MMYLVQIDGQITKLPTLCNKPDSYKYLSPVVIYNDVHFLLDHYSVLEQSAYYTETTPSRLGSCRPLPEIQVKRC